MTIRAAGRLCWFLAQVVVDVCDYGFTTAFVSPAGKRLARAGWLSRASRRHLKLFGFSIKAAGSIPQSGLLVSNHLSYLDILTISATTPCVFVSKAEVQGWPLFGWLAKLGGTVFIERERRTHVGEVNREIESALADGVLVVVFPEGTSSDGKAILPFRASLLEPALRGGHEISTAWLRYELGNGDAGNEVCYWGDHAFFPHLVNLLGKHPLKIRATLRFGKHQRATDDRKELAKQLHAAISELKEKS